MDRWLEAALDYARAKDQVGWVLLSAACGYLFLRVSSRLTAILGNASRLVLARYDRLLTDWEALNRRKNEELRAKDAEIAYLREQLRMARGDTDPTRERRKGPGGRRARDRAR